jgi:hypothetical protein
MSDYGETDDEAQARLEARGEDLYSQADDEAAGCQCWLAQQRDPECPVHGRDVEAPF